jgi:hypothetical protein
MADPTLISWVGGILSIESMLERTMGLFSRVPHLSMCRTARVYTACPHPPTLPFLLTWARWVSISCWHGQGESLFLVDMGKGSLYFLLTWARWVSISCWHGQGESLFIVDMGKVSLYLLLTWARWVSVSFDMGKGSLCYVVVDRGRKEWVIDMGKRSLCWHGQSRVRVLLTSVRGISVDMGKAE